MGLSARRVASFEYLAARAVSASDAEPGAQPFASSLHRAACSRR